MKYYFWFVWVCISVTALMGNISKPPLSFSFVIRVGIASLILNKNAQAIEEERKGKTH